MDFTEYQRQTSDTDQFNAAQTSGGSRTPNEGEAYDAGLVVHLLGLAGEAGSVASEYKKRLRDGEAHHWWKARMREELGDVLWYVANVASHVGLDLDEVAQANITKTRSRWLTSPMAALDTDYPTHEQLPRAGVYEFRSGTNADGRESVRIYFEGRQIGDELTDASHNEDGYRFHDVFHLAYATLLGWSPVTRSLAGLKRRSVQRTDENEDGGRAIAIEEGVAATVFAYAGQHQMGKTLKRLDQRLLDNIEMLVGPLEVGVRTPAEWEVAILAGLSAFRSLVANNGGYVLFDADSARFEYSTDGVTASPGDE
jgi:NTP pyrophosphatase (non-canonical NTP hydrolase)